MTDEEIQSLVLDLAKTHEDTWQDKPDWYWFLALVKEFTELGLSLLGLHKDPPRWELAQISSICINWLRKRDGQ